MRLPFKYQTGRCVVVVAAAAAAAAIAVKSMVGGSQMVLGRAGTALQTFRAKGWRVRVKGQQVQM
jgi:hypothetical protein